MKVSVNKQSGDFIISGVSQRQMEIIHSQISKSIIALEYQKNLSDADFVQHMLNEAEAMSKTIQMKFDMEEVRLRLSSKPALRELRSNIEKEINSLGRMLEDLNMGIKQHIQVPELDV